MAYAPSGRADDYNKCIPADDHPCEDEKGKKTGCGILAVQSTISTSSTINLVLSPSGQLKLDSDGGFCRFSKCIPSLQITISRCGIFRRSLRSADFQFKKAF
jgi:hypothetical protein